MKNLEHSTVRYGCRIDHDLENTVSVLRDPDDAEHNFVSNDAEPNALLQAIHWAKADQQQRLDAKLGAPRAMNEQSVERPVEQAEFDDASEGPDTDVVLADDATELEGESEGEG